MIAVDGEDRQAHLEAFNVKVGLPAVSGLTPCQSFHSIVKG